MDLVIPLIKEAIENRIIKSQLILENIFKVICEA